MTGSFVRRPVRFLRLWSCMSPPCGYVYHDQYHVVVRQVGLSVRLDVAAVTPRSGVVLLPISRTRFDT